MKIKRISMIIIIIIMCMVNSKIFAAIISDNDGSAFVTKAEFDALKASFNKQIADYNASIDGKIDGAIASYLAGININKIPKNYLDIVNSSVGGTLWFKNKVDNIGGSSITTDFTYNLMRHYTYQYYNSLIWSAKLKPSTSCQMASLYVGSEVFSAENATSPYNERVSYYDLEMSSYALKTTYHGNNVIPDSIMDKWAGKFGNATKSKNNILNTVSQNTPGSGTGWISETKPNGIMVLKQYCTSLFPRVKLEITSHTYLDKTSTSKDTFNSYYATQGGLGDTRVLDSILVPRMTVWGSTGIVGDKIITESTSDKKTSYSLTQTMAKTSDGDDYSVYMWGKGSDTNIYFQDNNVLPTVSGSSTTVASSVTKSEFRDQYFTSRTVHIDSNTLSGQEFSYYPISVSNNSAKVNTFSNEYISAIAGEDVKVDGGIPIAETYEDEQTIKLRFKLKARNASTKASTTTTVHYEIADKKFHNGAVETGGTLLASGDISTGTDNEVSIDLTKKSLVWINLYSTSSSSIDVAFDTFDIA